MDLEALSEIIWKLHEIAALHTCETEYAWKNVSLGYQNDDISIGINNIRFFVLCVTYLLAGAHFVETDSIIKAFVLLYMWGHAHPEQLQASASCTGSFVFQHTTYQAMQSTTFYTVHNNQRHSSDVPYARYPDPGSLMETRRWCSHGRPRAQLQRGHWSQLAWLQNSERQHSVNPAGVRVASLSSVTSTPHIVYALVHNALIIEMQDFLECQGSAKPRRGSSLGRGPRWVQYDYEVPHWVHQATFSIEICI